ncbi:MAG: hypothetical protein OXE73_02075, partial [Gammaproteobacteria bacterium]|nr:hypothetical protein [Gammaproteobacteria bacterium]
APAQPLLHSGTLVGSVVVEDEVQVELRVASFFDGAQEAKKLPGAGGGADTGWMTSPVAVSSVVVPWRL